MKDELQITLRSRWLFMVCLLWNGEGNKKKNEATAKVGDFYFTLLAGGYGRIQPNTALALSPRKANDSRSRKFSFSRATSSSFIKPFRFQDHNK